jgi:hypothetical protein
MLNSTITIKIKQRINKIDSQDYDNIELKKQKLKEYTKKYYQLNKEKILTRIKENSKTEEFKEKRRVFNKKRKEINRATYYKKRYGITLEVYNKMLLDQDYKCAICKISETEIKHKRNTYFAVDHCHKTGKVRGLLCNNCNCILGFINDDTEHLNNAIKYLENA